MPYSKLLLPHKLIAKLIAATTAFLSLAGFASATESTFSISIIAEGLNSPTGIAMKSNNILYFSEVPTPGVSGMNGGENKVKRLKISNRGIRTISEGEPYPSNLAVDCQGKVFWTCKTAGVILQYTRGGGRSFFLPPNPMDPNASFLLSPNGIAVDKNGDVLFTEIPMPGTSGANMVSVSDGMNISLISDDEPAPTDIAIAQDGTAYWTCQTAGVIVKRSPAGVKSLLKTGLENPTGIAINFLGNKLYFTELPTPGVSGADGGSNRVVEMNLGTGQCCIVSEGFPSPTDVTVSFIGKVYWTCTKAGVIACATPNYLIN